MKGSASSQESTEFLAVHYFRTSRVRHWISQDVFISPEFLLVKVYAAIVNIGLEFIPSAYPSVQALGNIDLPAAFIKGSPADYQGILRYLQTISDLDENASSASKEERDALIVHAQSVLKDAIMYTLWGHPECYSKFTLPVMKDSMPRPFADIYSAESHREWEVRDRGLIDSKLKKFFKYLNSKLRSGRFFFPVTIASAEFPSICDVVLYSFLSVLLSIPDKFSPFFFASDSQSEETGEIVQSLKTFLLDFDDWLWQLNAKRSQQIQDPSLIPSAHMAAAGSAVLSSEATREEAYDENAPSSEKDVRPLLGTTDRMQNLVFLTAAVGIMLGAVLVS